jgi:hypothetical protein
VYQTLLVPEFQSGALPPQSVLSLPTSVGVGHFARTIAMEAVCLLRHLHVRRQRRWLSRSRAASSVVACRLS